MHSSSPDKFHDCVYCCFRSNDRVILIKHLFESHCLQENFRYGCEIPLCAHYFTTGATYASFLTHCNRKHGNWRRILSSDIHCSDDHTDHQSMDTDHDRACGDIFYQLELPDTELNDGSSFNTDSVGQVTF